MTSVTAGIPFMLAAMFIFSANDALASTSPLCARWRSFC